MTNIVATPQQFLCRNLFKDAVEYAKTVIADPVRKAAWQNTLKRRNGVYNEAIKEYMNKARLEKQRAATATRRLIVRAFKNQPADEMIGTATYNVGKAPAILTTSHRNLIGTRCKNQDQKNRINSGYKWKSINQTQH